MRDLEPEGTPNVPLSHLSFSRTSLGLGLQWDWTTGIATLEAEDRGAKEGRGWPGMGPGGREAESQTWAHLPQSHRALCLTCDTLQLTQSFLSSRLLPDTPSSRKPSGIFPGSFAAHSPGFPRPTWVS